MTTPVRRGRRFRACVLLAALATVAACGSYHSEQELIAATSGTPDQAQTGSSFDPGVTVDGGSVASPDDTAAGSTGGGDSVATPGQSSGGGGGADAPQQAPGQEAAGPAGPAGPSGPTCTGDEEPLKIATIGQQSGVFGPFMQPIVQGVQAWITRANANGGVACHQVQLIVRDDGGDPSVHQSEVKQLVESENVIAFVGTTAVLTGGSSMRYLTDKGVPVIGNEGGSEWFYESPVFRPQVTTGNLALGAIVEAVASVGRQQGFTKLAVVSCLEAALCSSLHGDAPRLAREAGLQLVYNTQASLTQLDFTSICQTAEDRGAEMFIIGLDTNSIQRVLRNCQSIGFKPLAITGGPLVTPGLLEDPRAEGFLVASATDLYTNDSNPAVADYLQALTTYAPGAQPSIASLVGWTAAELFGVGLANAPEATRAGLLEGLDKIDGNNLGGLTYPLAFTAGQPAPRVACMWIGQVKGGNLVLAPGASAKGTCG